MRPLVAAVVLMLTLKPTSPEPSASESFLVKFGDCTGSIVADDWVLTAAHCFAGETARFRSARNEFGDLELTPRFNLSLGVFRPLFRTPQANQTEWTRGLRGTDPSGVVIDGNPWQTVFWRAARRVLTHGDFAGEALSWKGNDVALIELMPEEISNSEPGIRTFPASPICLAEKGFDEFRQLDYGPGGPVHGFIAGYGRRRIPHCITDGTGPEGFLPCARDVACSLNHRATFCPVSFVYNGERHAECIRDAPTPASRDPKCRRLRRNVPASANVTAHIFRSRSLLATCRPERVPDGGKGWCVTRRSGRTENEEPTATAGWGFCSTEDPFQTDCNEEIDPNTKDTSPLPASVLTDRHCVEKLMENLNAEQPGVREEQLSPLLPKSKVFCLGRNYTHSFARDSFYLVNGSNEYRLVEGSPDLQEAVFLKGGAKRFHMDGGPSCFGDSGGPFWKLASDPETGRKVPVMVGVFSFLLWGTCHGEDDPSYYTRVASFNDWIFRYVPKNDTCGFSHRYNDWRSDSIHLRSTKDKAKDVVVQVESTE